MSHIPRIINMETNVQKSEWFPAQRECLATHQSIIISERRPSLQGHHLFIFLFFSMINKNSQLVFILFQDTLPAEWLHWLLCDMILVYCLFIETLHNSKLSRVVF